jgi:hypothetical protein
MTEMEFELGVGAAATLLVVAACLGLGGFLAWSGFVDQPEPLVVAGRQVLGREGTRYALSASLLCSARNSRAAPCPIEASTGPAEWSRPTRGCRDSGPVGTSPPSAPGGADEEAVAG